MAIFAGLVLGKPTGVVAMSWLALRLGARGATRHNPEDASRRTPDSVGLHHGLLGLATRPEALSWPFLCAGTLLTGIGFTMALFIAGLAYSPDTLDTAKMGILAGSVVSAARGLSALGWLGRKRRAA